INSDYGLFLLSGAFQYILDITLFAALVFWGIAPVHANIFSRCVAACAGFFLNGYYVFGFLRSASILRIFHASLKFILLLALMTLLSSFLIASLVKLLPDYYLLVLLTKILVEIMLAVLSFLIQ